jgi:hypothetical protein
MYDSCERDTICFRKLFEYLSDDFVEQYEKNTQRAVRTEIESARDEFNNLNGSHLVGRLRTARNKMFAHTATYVDRDQVAEYGHAEQLLKRTLPMLNNINSAIRGKPEPYDKISKFWKGYAIEFWQSLINDT